MPFQGSLNKFFVKDTNGTEYELKSLILKNIDETRNYEASGVTGLHRISILSLTGIHLEKIVIPDNLDSIPLYYYYLPDYDTLAFEGTMQQFLEKRWSRGTFNVLTIDGEEISGPTLVIPEGVTAIPDSAFSGWNGRSSITSISFPSTLQSIGKNAFEGFTNLHSLVLPSGVSHIGDYAFYGCTSLDSLVIPQGITYFGSNAFSRCTNLTSVTLSEGLTVIGFRAFADDTNLREVYIPPTVESIGSNAFSGVQHIIYHGSATGTPWGALFVNGFVEGRFVYSDSTRTRLIYCLPGDSVAVVPGSVVTLADGAFANSHLAELHLPAVTQIGATYRFTGVRHLYYTGESVWNKSLSNGHFYENWGFGADSINYEADGIIYADPEHTEVYDSRRNIMGALTLPEGVQTIRRQAFYYRKDITAVTLPSTLDSIGPNAFYYCDGIAALHLNDSLRSIGERAFEGAFAGIDTLLIPDKVESVGAFAFSTARFSNVVLGRGLRTVGINAFKAAAGTYSQSLLQSTIFTGSMEDWLSIDWGYSYNNYEANPTYSSHNLIINGEELTHLVVPEGIITIKPFAFVGLATLATITLPASLLSIEGYNNNGSFLGIPGNLSVDTVYAHGTTAPTGGRDYTWSNSVFVIPCGALQSYQSRWGYGRTYIFAHPETVVTVLTDNPVQGTATLVGEVDCDTNATVQATAAPHYHFLRWSDGSRANPYTLHLDGDSTLTAFFAIDSFTVAVEHDTSQMSVEGTGIYPYGTNVTLTVAPHYGYEFEHGLPDWSQDPGSGVLTRTVHVTGDINFSLVINRKVMVVGSMAYGPGTVYVSGADGNRYLDEVTVAATPQPGKRFLHWNDEVPENPRSLILTCDTSFTAYFGNADTVDVHDTTIIHDTSYVDVFVPVHDTTIIHDTSFVDVFVPVHDTTYIDIHDTTYINVPYPVHDTTIVVDTLTVTQYDTITNTVYDTIDNYIYDTLTLTDTLWLTHCDTIWLHDTIVIHDTVYITQEGIDGAEAINAKVYSSQGQIVVEGADGHTVTLYDVNGRILATKQDDYMPQRFDALTSGVYLVKIGSLPARRVVVIR